MQALACLMKYLNLPTDPMNAGQYRFRREDLQTYMKLDYAAVKALNLFTYSGFAEDQSSSEWQTFVYSCIAV